MKRTIGTVVGATFAAALLAGCVAEPRYGHRYGGGYGYGQPYYGGGYQDRDYSHDYDRSYDRDYDRHSGRHDRDQATVVCASQDGRANRCRLDFRISHAEVDKRYSSSRCDYGRTWGYDSNEVWVDRGCRARFRVTRR
jgi:hypothetical protein